MDSNMLLIPIFYSKTIGATGKCIWTKLCNFLRAITYYKMKVLCVKLRFLIKKNDKVDIALSLQDHRWGCDLGPTLHFLRHFSFCHFVFNILQIIISKVFSPFN